MAHRAIITADTPFRKPFEAAENTYWFALFMDDAAVNPRRAEGIGEIAVMLPTTPTANSLTDAISSAVIARGADIGWTVTAARCWMQTWRNGA